MKQEKIDLNELIPNYNVNVKTGRTHKIQKIIEAQFINVKYDTPLHNHTGRCGAKSYYLFLPRFISATDETFEVLGLLQGEMGKQHDGKVVFCNHEYQIVNKVIEWFERELRFPKEEWKWSIKLNINEPEDEEYRKKTEEIVINYWLKNTKLTLGRAYPKKVTYIKNTKNKKRKENDHGTLIFERKSNLFSQVVKKLLCELTARMPEQRPSNIRAYMKGIIAAESNVEVNLGFKSYRIHITAVDPEERSIFQRCLAKLYIESNQHKHGKLLISRKKNNLELLNQDLMSGSPEKHNKFLWMMKLYGNYEKYRDKKHIHDIPDWLVDEVLEFHLDCPDWSARRIVNELAGLVNEEKVHEVKKWLKEWDSLLTESSP